jgi:hypothetical protein
VDIRVETLVEMAGQIGAGRLHGSDQQAIKTFEAHQCCAGPPAVDVVASCCRRVVAEEDQQIKAAV